VITLFLLIVGVVACAVDSPESRIISMVKRQEEILAYMRREAERKKEREEKRKRTEQEAEREAKRMEQEVKRMEQEAKRYMRQLRKLRKEQ
jgi:hypothetical protein